MMFPRERILKELEKSEEELSRLKDALDAIHSANVDGSSTLYGYDTVHKILDLNTQSNFELLRLQDALKREVLGMK